MRNLLIALAAAGAALAVIGAATAVGWVILVGCGALAVAAVMAALTLPSISRGRRGGAS